ncbi:MAG: ABC transporter substrate-binding protein [Candidatus Dormibacteraceae bacterium]
MTDRHRMRAATAVLALFSIALMACSPGQSSSGGSTGGGKLGGSVNVLAVWAANEQDSFLAMVKPFEDQTGVKVKYESTRDINATLTTRIQAGNPPELAGLPGPGQMFDFAKNGKLQPLDNVLDMNTMNQQYAPDWVKLGQYNGKTYSIFIKTALKGLVWYDPKNFQAKGYTVPKTWADLTALEAKITADGASPWCIGLESGSASGWPGSDWVKEFVLSQSGPTAYDAWWQGKQKWSSPEVKQAWQTWGKIVPSQVYGGSKTMVSTNFADSPNPMFASPPKCYMHNQGSFMSDIILKNNPSLKLGTDLSFFSLPDVDPANAGSHVVAGDLFGMFKDTPQARALIKYLTTPEAQSIWVKRGGAISPNKQVKLADYPDDLSRQIAEQLVSAKIARFDAGDLMPSAMQAQYFKAVLDFTQDPSKLDSILAACDAVQATAYK